MIMKEIRGVVSENVEKKFRELAMKRFGYRKGSLSKALEEERAGNIDEAFNWLEKTKTLDSEYIKRMENAPDEAFQELFEQTSKEMDKQSFLKDQKEKLKDLSEIEKEWKDKYKR